MIKINPLNLDDILKVHIENVKKYVNYEVLGNEEKRYIKENIGRIIAIKPNEMEALVTENKFKRIDSIKLKKAFVGGNKYGGNIGYTKFSSKNTANYNAYTLAESLDIRVCPYCNRNYTFTIKDKNSKSTRPDFDHFYDKASYPLLALSFYNLIPSCILCNSRLKGRKEFSLSTHLHPYVDSFNDYGDFKVKIENSSFYYSTKGFSLSLETKNKRAENIKKDFALETLYQEHKDVVLELIQKREIYNDSYIDELYKNYEGTLFKNREDVLRHIVGTYIEDKDLDKRPLSKLVKDISEELDLI